MNSKLPENTQRFLENYCGSNSSKASHPKAKDLIQYLPVTSKELTNGSLRNVTIYRNVICKPCFGIGGPKETFKKCNNCQGTGIEDQTRFIFDHYEHNEKICSECLGKGKIIDHKDLCKICNGKGTVRDRKTLQIKIEKGMESSEKLLFRGEGDQSLEMEAGDVVVAMLKVN